jgi:hypothetical protein
MRRITDTKLTEQQSISHAHLLNISVLIACLHIQNAQKVAKTCDALVAYEHDSGFCESSLNFEAQIYFNKCTEI